MHFGSAEADRLNETVKTQRVRLLDVLVVGPLMVLGGYALARGGHPVLGLTLSALGFSTAVYNGANWGRVQAAREVP